MENQKAPEETKENQVLPTELDRVDQLEFNWLHNKVDKIAAQITALRLQLQTIEPTLKPAQTQFERFQKQLVEKYKLSKTDGFDPETGRISRLES